MRVSSTHGKIGNNYRYQRAVKEIEATRERKHSSDIWDGIYKKASDSDQKVYDSEQKVDDAYKDIDDINYPNT
jgi:hypothetical protein